MLFRRIDGCLGRSGRHSRLGHCSVMSLTSEGGRVWYLIYWGILTVGWFVLGATVVLGTVQGGDVMATGFCF